FSSTGLLSTVKNGNGFITRTEYDGAGRAVRVIGPAEAGSPTTTTEYDNVGNVIATITPLGHVASANPNDYRWDYVYDGRNRKVKEIHPAAAAGQSRP